MSKRTKGAGSPGQVPGRGSLDQGTPCSQIQHQLLESLHPGEPLSSELERHLAECSRCRSLRSQITLLDEVAKEQAPELPQGFELSLRRRLEESSKTRTEARRAKGSPARHWGRIALASAALVLISVAAVLWLTTHRPREEASPTYHRLRLAIQSGEELKEVLFSVELPEGVRPLPGAGGLVSDGRSLKWRSAIQRGQNELDLPLLAVRPRGQVLVRLQVGTRQWSHSISFDPSRPSAIKPSPDSPVRLALMLEPATEEKRGLP